MNALRLIRMLCCAAAVAGAGCSKAKDGPVSDSPRPPEDQPPAPTRPSVTSYPDLPAVEGARLTPAGEVKFQPQYLAVAPSGPRWAAATAGEVQLYAGTDAEARRPVRFEAGGGIDFSADGSELYLGLRTLEVSSGGFGSDPAVPDLAAWASGKGLPAPPTLQVEGARRSPDGAVVVVSATGRTRDRRRGQSRPESGSEDWLIELDGSSGEPRRALWHGRGPHQRISISDRYVAAGGRGGLRVFPRGGGDAVDLTGQLRAIVTLAWSPDGELLVALGEQNKVAVWKAGSFDQPVATWSFGSDYGSALGFHPTRPLLFTGGRDGHVRLWSLDTARLGQPVEIAALDLGGVINQVTPTPDGDAVLVAVGAPAGVIKRFDLTLSP